MPGEKIIIDVIRRLATGRVNRPGKIGDGTMRNEREKQGEKKAKELEQAEKKGRTA